jgi:hypothetical protein
MFEILRTGERLTIVDGNAKKAFIGGLVVTVVAGIGMIGCGLVTDTINAAPYREAGLPYLYATTILFAVLTLLLGLFLLALSHHTEVVLDRAQGMLRVIRVRPLGASIRRDVPLASVRGARVVGSLGAFWQFEFELDSGAPLAVPSMRTDAYAPGELQGIADQVNQFLVGLGQGAAPPRSS